MIQNIQIGKPLTIEDEYEKHALRPFAVMRYNIVNGPQWGGLIGFGPNNQGVITGVVMVMENGIAGCPLLLSSIEASVKPEEY